MSYIFLRSGDSPKQTPSGIIANAPTQSFNIAYGTLSVTYTNTPVYQYFYDTVNDTFLRLTAFEQESVVSTDPYATLPSGFQYPQDPEIYVQDVGYSDDLNGSYSSNPVIVPEFDPGYPGQTTDFPNWSLTTLGFLKAGYNAFLTTHGAPAT